MRKREMQLFDAPCEDRDFEDFFAEVVGLPLLPIHEFRRELLGDLDTGEIFGFGWWAEYRELGDRRRIFITDCLIQAVQSIAVNLVEAKLHLLESVDWLDRESTQMRNAIVEIEERPKLRPRTTAKEGLAERMIVLHSAGFFRAINSAFDCLGGALVGVAGLPENILRADLNGARAALTASAQIGTPGAQAQAELGASFEQAIDTSGRKGWLQWATNFRNMLTHRGRRMHPGNLNYRDTVVTDHRERPFAITEVHRLFRWSPAGRRSSLFSTRGLRRSVSLALKPCRGF